MVQTALDLLVATAAIVIIPRTFTSTKVAVIFLFSFFVHEATGTSIVPFAVVVEVGDCRAVEVGSAGTGCDAVIQLVCQQRQQ